jgi:hypothetical protein
VTCLARRAGSERFSKILAFRVGDSHGPNGVRQGKGIKPHRPLEDDLKLTDYAMSYDGSAARRSTVEMQNKPLVSSRRGNEADTPSGDIRLLTSAVTEVEISDWPKRSDGKPDFDKMTSAQHRPYDETRLKRIFG